MTTEAKRLVLAYDAHCPFCHDIALKIQAESDGRLELMDLPEPEAVAWREEAFGEDVSWTPTLIEVSPSGVRAWTGRRMALAIGLRLGPLAAWRLSRSLGELTAPFNSEDEEPALLTRSQALRKIAMGAAGMILAFNLLDPSSLAQSAEAAAASPSPRAACCIGLCYDCYRKYGRRCAACDQVRRCKEYNESDCDGCNCRCEARYC